MTLLSIQGLTAGYGQVSVLHGIDLEVNDGEIVVMLGANGAGKTTTLRAISGLIPRQGVIQLEGRNIQKAGPEVMVRGGVAHVPQGRGTFPELSVEDNMHAGAFTRRGGSSEVASDIAKWFEVFPRLQERRTQRAGSLSGGE
ncbi:MAG: ATP-binding cassette domain-containing protein, partial [Actinomycetota bacterium]|nr:ATP-binding cassette domain-containing protein [Actinomycetota bacterium]